MFTTHRRQFLQHSMAATAAFALPSLIATRATAADRPKLRKAVKYGMIREGNSIQEKFELIKSIGFEGVELNSPSNMDREEAKRAAQSTGIVIHGLVDSVHWNIRLSDPDPAVRAKGVEALSTALDDAHFYGATTVLLVPGKVTDPEKENYEQVYSRSQAEVRKVLPQAEKLGVKIGIEVVWNDFITKPEQFVQYLDDFQSPMVGGYLDASNMLKYGATEAEWVRALGKKRLLKLDIKGYHLEKQWVPIGEGSENYPEFLKALGEIGFEGWATAEVAGGGRKELKDIAERMNRVLQLG